MKIKDVARVVGGATPSTKHPEYYNGKIVWATPKDLSIQNNKFFSSGERTITEKGLSSCAAEMIPANNILMSSRAPIGLLAINTVDCCTNQGFKNLILDSNLCDVHFMYYYLKYHIKAIEALGSGTTFKEVSKSSLEEWEIFIPDLDEQKKIGGFLAGVDEKIVNNKKVSSTLECLARMIYDYWFVQFDFPNDLGRPYKSSGGKMVWNDELNRKIPEGWEVKSLFEVTDVCYGIPLLTKEFSDSGLPVVRIRDILNNSTSAFTSQQVDDKFLTREGDLLIGMDGNFQMNYWFHFGDCVNQRIVRIRKKEVPVMIVRFQVEPYIKSKVDNVARSTVGHLSDGDLKSLRIVVPKDVSMLNVFDSYLKKICSLGAENRQLESLRDFFLPLLMSRQVAFR